MKIANKGQDDSTPVLLSQLRFSKKPAESGRTCGKTFVFVEQPRFKGQLTAYRHRKLSPQASVNSEIGVICQPDARTQDSPNSPNLSPDD